MKINKLQKGFTLIELMIVVAVIGILAAIAYPSYKDYVARARRSEAVAVLISAQQWMETFYTENFRYDKDSAGTAVAALFKKRFEYSPPKGQGAPVYDITVVVPDGKTDEYKIKATPISGTIMASDKCGVFTIDHLGRKALSPPGGSTETTALKEFCWK